MEDGIPRFVRNENSVPWRGWGGLAMKIVEKEMVEVGVRGARAAHPAARTNVRAPDATAERSERPEARGAECDSGAKSCGELGSEADFQAAEALLLLGRRGLMSRPDGTALLLLPIT